MEDDFSAARQRMVGEQLARRDVSDPRVLDAMRAVARHRFVPPELRAQAYADRALPIGGDQTISQPYIVAVMTEALAPGRDERVLEIGTGSGYQTAVLAELAGEVFTIERRPDLAERAQERLDDLGYGNVRYRMGDGTLGWPEGAPFDGVLVTAGAPAVPEDLGDQLTAPGGRIIIPVGDRMGQDLYRYTRGNGGLEREWITSARFVPLVGEEGWGER